MNQQFIDFENALKNKFLELRSNFNSEEKSLTELISDQLFQKLFIIDRTVSIPQIFEAGYLLWEECNRDLDKFFKLFTVTVENDRLALKIIEENNEENDKSK